MLLQQRAVDRGFYKSLETQNRRRIAEYMTTGRRSKSSHVGCTTTDVATCQSCITSSTVRIFSERP